MAYCAADSGASTSVRCMRGERGCTTYDDDKTLFFAAVRSFNAAVAAVVILPRLQKGLFFKRPNMCAPALNISR